MGNISAIVIEFLNQEKYEKLISYIEEAGAVEVRYADRREPIYKIESIEEVSGNPPKYKNIKIKITDNIDINKEGRHRVKKSLKGLVDLLG